MDNGITKGLRISFITMVTISLLSNYCIDTLFSNSQYKNLIWIITAIFLWGIAIFFIRKDFKKPSIIKAIDWKKLSKSNSLLSQSTTIIGSLTFILVTILLGMFLVSDFYPKIDLAYLGIRLFATPLLLGLGITLLLLARASYLLGSKEYQMEIIFSGISFYFAVYLLRLLYF